MSDTLTILSFIINQEILLAFIAGIFTMVIASGKSRNRYVTEDREKWRDKTREWIFDVTQMIHDGWDKNRLEAKKNEIILRLNPVSDKVLQKAIEKLSIDTKDAEANLALVVLYLQRLLKDDWEKVKKSQSLLGGTYFFNLSIFILIVYSFMMSIESLTSDNPEFNIKYLFGILCVVLGKFFLVEIEKIPVVREITSINVFKRYRWSVNMPSLSEILVTMITFFIVSCIINDIVFFTHLFIFHVIILTIWIIVKIKESCKIEQERSWAEREIE
ncbi:MAG: hypothetical protein U1C51_01825 [Candidatus Izemoplasmatales bacterium]|nr:hypothetical protein [Candidatus Izemoplasmatales bacterium]